jgi:conjugal transfer pilus assembly protein TraE
MHASKAIENGKRLNVKLTAMAGALMLSISGNLVMGLLALNSREVVLVPTLPDELSLKTGGLVGADYLERVARDATFLFLNRTPETDRYFERSMEAICDATTYQQIKSAMVDDRKQRQDTRTSQAWFPNDFYVDSAKLLVEVRGILETSKGSEIVQSAPKIYQLRFVRRGSSVRLTSIIEIKPEASEGEKVKPTNEVQP